MVSPLEAHLCSDVSPADTRASTLNGSAIWEVDDEERAGKEEKEGAKQEGEADDPIWVEWESADPENPYEWSLSRRWRIATLSCLFTFISAFAGSGFSMGFPSMRVDLRCSSELASMAFAAFPLGFGLAPLVLAPFSEAYGRYWMYVVSIIVYTIFLIPIARAQNIATVIVCRLIAGLACSTGSTLVGGTIADLFHSTNRGPVMMLFTLSAFMGSVLLSRRAAKLRSTTGDPRYQCKADAERASLLILVKVSMTRPLYLLFTEPVLASISLWAGLSWGILFLCLEAVPDVMRSVYGFNQGEIGTTFISVGLAAIIGSGMNVYQERLYQRTAGIFIFAFSQGRGHWMGPVCGLVVLFTGVFAIYLAAFNYLADVYNVYASSALSGMSLSRNLFGAVFPLFTQQMYARLGFQWASFLAGCLAGIMAVVPWTLLAFGPRIRARSTFASALGGPD
ncbi:hypothetical protein RQP46_009303 [Phenoliferia psychrophenolica]